MSPSLLTVARGNVRFWIRSLGAAPQAEASRSVRHSEAGPSWNLASSDTWVRAKWPLLSECKASCKASPFAVTAQSARSVGKLQEAAWFSAAAKISGWFAQHRFEQLQDLCCRIFRVRELPEICLVLRHVRTTCLQHLAAACLTLASETLRCQCL